MGSKADVAVESSNYYNSKEQVVWLNPSVSEGFLIDE